MAGQEGSNDTHNDATKGPRGQITEKEVRLGHVILKGNNAS